MRLLRTKRRKSPSGRARAGGHCKPSFGTSAPQRHGTFWHLPPNADARRKRGTGGRARCMRWPRSALLGCKALKSAHLSSRPTVSAEALNSQLAVDPVIMLHVNLPTLLDLTDSEVESSDDGSDIDQHTQSRNWTFTPDGAIVPNAPDRSTPQPAKVYQYGRNTGNTACLFGRNSLLPQVTACL